MPTETRNHLARALIALLALCAGAATRAANFCVGTSTQLQTALTTAASNNENDVIRVKTGTYTGTSGVAFAYSTAQSFDLTVMGGYLDVSGTPCAGQTQDPLATVLSGSGARPVMRLSPASGTDGTIFIQRLTVRDGVAGERGGGIQVAANGHTGRVNIDRVYFDRNQAPFGGGLSIASSGLVGVRNSVFLLNTATAGAAQAEITVNHTNLTTQRMDVTNNTFFGGQSESDSTTGGISLSGQHHGVLANNLFAMNDGNDVQIVLAATTIDLFHNNINLLTGTPAQQAGNLNFANPQVVDFLNDDLRLRDNSPMRNAGDGALIASTNDFAGDDRVAEGEVDIGAFEYQPLFNHGFENAQ